MRKVTISIYSDESDGYDRGERLDLFDVGEDIKVEIQRHLRVHAGQKVRRETRLQFLMPEIGDTNDNTDGKGT
jgi:hypothetical protein